VVVDTPHHQAWLPPWASFAARSRAGREHAPCPRRDDGRPHRPPLPRPSPSTCHRPSGWLAGTRARRAAPSLIVPLQHATATAPSSSPPAVLARPLSPLTVSRTSRERMFRFQSSPKFYPTDGIVRSRARQVRCAIDHTGHISKTVRRSTTTGSRHRACRCRAQALRSFC
jgi:hypothetical protein